jgi:hypothetical protein
MSPTAGVLRLFNRNMSERCVLFTC